MLLVCRGELGCWLKMKWSSDALFQHSNFGILNRAIGLRFWKSRGWSCLTWMWSFKRIKVREEWVLASLMLWVQRWVSDNFGQISLDHLSSFLFIFIFISFGHLRFTSLVLILVKSHKCCNQVLSKPLI